MDIHTQKHRVYKDTFQWHCVERKTCRARIHTNGTNVLKKTNEHTHEPNSKIFHCNVVKAGIKRKAADTQETTHSIVVSEISKLDEKSAVYPPRLDSLKRTICRSRKRAENVPSEPTSLIQFKFQKHLQRITKANLSFSTILVL